MYELGGKAVGVGASAASKPSVDCNSTCNRKLHGGAAPAAAELCTQLYGPSTSLNLLKPTGHVMHHPFNIQQLYALPTLYLCVLYLSENKQRLVPLTAQTDRFL